MRNDVWELSLLKLLRLSVYNICQGIFGDGKRKMVQENLGWNDGSCNGDFDTAEISGGFDDKVEIVRREWIESDPYLGTGAAAFF